MNNPKTPSKEWPSRFGITKSGLIVNGQAVRLAAEIRPGDTYEGDRLEIYVSTSEHEAKLLEVRAEAIQDVLEFVPEGRLKTKMLKMIETSRSTAGEKLAEQIEAAGRDGNA